MGGQDRVGQMGTGGLGQGSRGWGPDGKPLGARWGTGQIMADGGYRRPGDRQGTKQEGGQMGGGG